MGRRLALVILALLAWLTPAPARAQTAGGELLERTLAIVGGSVLTQSDAALAEGLRLLAGSPVPDGPLLTRLVDRHLMLHEVDRFAPAEPPPDQVAARLAQVRTEAGGDAALTAVLARTGRALEDLDLWLRDDLRVAAYLAQRFASAGAPADADVAAWIAANPTAVAGATPAEASRMAREQIARARRADLVADWLADVRKRVEVVTFVNPGDGA